MLKKPFCWAYFLGSLFSEELVIRRNFVFQNGIGLGNKNSLKHYENSLKQLKTANTNSPWAYIREGVLLEGFLHLRFEGLILWRAYFWGYLLSEFYGTLLFNKLMEFQNHVFIKQ